MSNFPRTLIVSLLVLLCSCSSMRTFQQENNTLAAINENLRSRSARVVCCDGRVFEQAWNVQIDPTHTRFTTPTSMETLPTETIDKVFAIRASRAVVGAALGVVPGAVMVASAREGPEDEFGSELAKEVQSSAGIIVMVTGGVLGYIVGRFAAPPEELLVYTGPIEDYLP